MVRRRQSALEHVRIGANFGIYGGWAAHYRSSPPLPPLDPKLELAGDPLGSSCGVIGPTIAEFVVDLIVALPHAPDHGVLVGRDREGRHVEMEVAHDQMQV